MGLNSLVNKYQVIIAVNTLTSSSSQRLLVLSVQERAGSDNEANKLMLKFFQTG